MNLIKLSSQTSTEQFQVDSADPKVGHAFIYAWGPEHWKGTGYAFSLLLLIPAAFVCSKSRCTQNTRKLCLAASAEPQLNCIQQLRAAEKAKLASVTVAAVGGVSYAGDLPDSSASEQSRREKDELMPRHELFPNAATCAEPEGHSLQLAQLQVRQREQS